MNLYQKDPNYFVIFSELELDLLLKAFLSRKNSDHQVNLKHLLEKYLLVSNDDRALKLSAKIRGESHRVGNVRSTTELGGLDVGILDLSDVESGDATGHLKVGTSPELIALIQRIRQSGVAIFDDGQKIGLLDAGAIIVEDAAGLVLKPIR